MIFSKKEYDVNNKMDVYRALYLSQHVLVAALAAFTNMQLIERPKAIDASNSLVLLFREVSEKQKYKVIDIDENYFAIHWEIK